PFPFWIDKKIDIYTFRELFKKKMWKDLENNLSKEKWDVIVIGDYYIQKYPKRCMDWQKIPLNCREKIIKMVRKGTGLVYINPVNLDGEIKKAVERSISLTPNHYIVNGFPFSVFKTNLFKRIKIGTLGKGRIVVLNWRAQGLIPYTRYHDYNFSYEEVFYSLISKTLLWASKKETQIIEKVEKEENRLKVSLKDNSEVKKCKVTFWNGRREKEKEYTVEISGENLILPSDDLKNGLHFVNLLFKNKKGEIVDFLITSIEVKKPSCSVSISLNKEIFKIGEEIKGKGEIVGSDKNILLEIKCKDNYERLLFHQVKKGKTGSFEFSFSIKYPLTVLHFIEVELRKNERIIDTKRKEFYIPEVYLKKEPFTLLLWGGYQSYPNHIYPYVVKMAKKIGFETLFSGTVWQLEEHSKFQPEANMHLGLVNLNRVVLRHSQAEKILSEYKKTGDKKVLVRTPCLNDPEYKKKVKKKLQFCAEITEKYGPLIYFLGDEMSLTTETGGIPIDICFSPYCLDGFRKFLKEKFKNIGELNRKWNTNYSSWDEVMPFTYEESIEKNNYSPYLAHREYMEKVYANWFKFCSDCIREINPSALVGESGIEPKISAYGGYNWAERMKFEKAVSFYGVADIPISFTKRKDGYFGSWSIGYLDREASEQFDIWRALLHGQNMICYWYVPLLINPDLTLTSYGKFIKKYLFELKKGIGEILGNSEYIYTPVGIYYSQRNCHLSFLLKKTSSVDLYRVFIENVNNWNETLRKWGYNPEFISSEEIEKGILEKGNFKVLILPLSFILSEKEAIEIKKFVKRGGILIADAQTGIYDEYGKERKKGILDDILGVKRKNSKIVFNQLEFFTKSGKKFKTMFVENGIETKGEILANSKTSEISFGGMKIGFKDSERRNISINTYGKGKCIYTGAVKIDFDYEGGNFILDFLQSLNINPPLKVENENGRIPVEIGYFRDHGIEYFIVLQLPSHDKGINLKTISMKELLEKGKKVKISFNKKGYIYEIRKKRFMGYGDKIEDEIIPGIAKLYCVLNKKPEFTVSVEEKVIRGEVLKYKVKSNIEEYPVYLEVFSPDGKEIEYFSKTLFILKNYSSFIPISLNSKTGFYKIKFNDLITGKKTEKSFEVIR
ncbi:beta-galactosidase, partial [bacterium]|nr:beta-galactosidase [bacterium]